MLLLVRRTGLEDAVDALNSVDEAVDDYFYRLGCSVGSPERAALVRDLAAALPDVLTALGVAP